MNIGNKYILRLHYNYEDKRPQPDLEKFPYNDQLQYQLFIDLVNANKVYHVIALYDEGFAGNYIPGSKINEKMSLYGSLSTRGYYYFDYDKHNPGKPIFSFLSIHPSKFNLLSQESLKFANGVIENTNGEVYAEGYDDGVDTGLVLLSRDKSEEINWPLCSKSERYDYNFPSGQKNNCNVDYGSSCRKLIISKSDIKLEPSQQINPGAKYVIKPCTPIVPPSKPIPDTKVPVCIHDDRGNKIGELSNTYSFVGIDSTQQTPVKLTIGNLKGLKEWVFDVDYITLYRDVATGEFKYYFSDRNGEKTSNKDLVAYCADTKNCKMKDLNLFPNVRAYIKSTLTSADIGDFQGTGTVDEAAISLNVTNTLKSDPEFQKAVTGTYGQDGQDANSAEIAHRLAHNTRFKRSLKGDDGADGAPGSRGRTGASGKKGDDADPAEVAQELVTNKADELGKVLLHTTSATLGKTIIEYIEQDMPKDIAQEPDIQQAVATELKAEVAHRLAHNTRFKRSLKGDDGADGERGERGQDGTPGLPGPIGQPGPEGKPGPTGQQGPEGKPGPTGQQGPEGKPGPIGQSGPKGDSAEVANKVAKDPTFQAEISDILKGDIDFQRGVKGDPGDPAEVTHRLAHNTRFKRSLKGDDGERGEQGDQGLKGDTGSEGPRGDRGERGEVGPTGPQGRDGKQGEKGDQGEKGKDGVDSFPLDSESKRSIGELQKKPQLKVVPGESYNENKQEANIELEGVGVIATFLEIGYFFKNDDLYIRDHITGNNILIPKHFHFLTVVEDGFDNYKFAFCNNLGNLFFNYQKYAPEYAGVLEEYKLIDLRYIKNAANIDLSKYYFHHIHTPLFAVRKGEPEGQSLENYGVDVYEIARNKKIGTLVDEFGFFKDDQFHYIDHHQGYDHHSQEPNVRIENHEGNFQIDDHIIHPIILHDGRFDLLDYLSYS